MVIFIFKEKIYYFYLNLSYKLRSRRFSVSNPGLDENKWKFMDANRYQQIFTVVLSNQLARIVNAGTGEEVLIGDVFGRNLWKDIKSTDRSGINGCTDEYYVEYQTEYDWNWEDCESPTMWWHNGKKLYRGRCVSYYLK